MAKELLSDFNADKEKIEKFVLEIDLGKEKLSC